MFKIYLLLAGFALVVAGMGAPDMNFSSGFGRALSWVGLIVLLLAIVFL